MRALSKFVTFVGRYMGMFANVTLMANVGIIVYSVLGRMLFSKPLLGLVDMVAVIFALTSALSFCYTETQSGHVRMDLFIQKAPRVGKIILHTATGIIGMIVMVILMIAIYTYANKTFAAHNITMTVAIPFFPFVIVLAVSLTFFLIAMVYNFIKAYDEWRVK